uniref:Transmembrane protein n=1 Tax=Strongyloides venezuelensis TaxID=75913 RepID=A0A0K0FRT5_STRVS
MTVADDLETITCCTRTEIFLLTILIVLYFVVYYCSKKHSAKIISRLDKADRDLESGRSLLTDFIDKHRSANSVSSTVFQWLKQQFLPQLHPEL